MVERASRQRRRKRFAVASIIILLLGVLAVVDVSRQQAVWQARRAEASRFVALGRMELDGYPMASLAFARDHELTNLEVVEDEASPTGYRLEIGPFPGWKSVPEW